MTTIVIIALTIAIAWLLKDIRSFKGDAPRATPAIEVLEHGFVRCRMNSPTLNQWRELVAVGAKIRTITMKRERPLVTVHIRRKYFVFLSGDGLLCSDRNFEAYDLFEQFDSWVISNIDGSNIIIKPIPKELHLSPRA
jgi:hypothetical protein